MKKYELVVVFDPKLGESALQEEAKKLKEFIAASGGQDVSIDVWGRKEMAHRHGQNSAGYFVALNFSIEQGGIVDALTARLRIADGVIRFQTHRKIERRKKFPERRNLRRGSDAALFEEGAEVVEAEF